MRVLICGSRYYTDYGPIRREMEKLPPNTVIIRGAARGADSLAEELAYELGFQVISCPADWDKYGRAVGPIRNQFMLDEHKRSLVIAFPLGESRGTQDMINRARQAGVETKVISSAGAYPFRAFRASSLSVLNATSRYRSMIDATV